MQSMLDLDGLFCCVQINLRMKRDEHSFRVISQKSSLMMSILMKRIEKLTRID